MILNMKAPITVTEGICFPSICFPSLFKNPLSLIKRVLLKINIGIVIPRAVIMQITLFTMAKWSECLNISPILKPLLIPNQKTKFHLRSLVSHLRCRKVLVRGRCVTSWLFELFMMFISNNRLKSYVNIVPEYILSYKKIVQFAMLCTLGFSPCAVFADENGGEYSKKDVANLISQEERKQLNPTGLLAAIAKIESSTRTLAVNIKGKSIIASSVNDAKSIIQQKLEEGVTNIDIGVMQLNYRWHGKKFVDLDAMLDPRKNIAYAAKMLKSLKDQYGDWQSAIRYYHSYTPVYNMAYSRKVTLCWLES